MDLVLIIKEYATPVAVLITLIKGVLEYMQANTLKRSESLTEMRIRFNSNEKFREICYLADCNDPRLTQIDIKDRRDILGFYEEVALKTNSGLIRKQVAHYMFGYYAIKCWKCEYFWDSIEKYSIYWCLYRDFVYQMIDEEQKLAEDFRDEEKSDEESVMSIRANFRL